MKTLATSFLLALATYSATAQTAPAFKITCDGGSQSSQGSVVCETRDLTMASPGSQTLTIDGRDNGGIAVHGWDGPDVRIRAKVTTWAKTDQQARELFTKVAISTTGNTLRADAPSGNDKGWAVSYEVFVPRATALSMSTMNGGISLSDLQSTIRFEAVNGGVSLNDVAGKVSGKTVNGGLRIKLAGTGWMGEGLDVETTNGGISWELPPNYSAKLFTSTTHGSIKATNVATIKAGPLKREIATTLGQGGASIRAITTNGGIRIEQAAQ